jgi:hypothetical protein
LLPSADCTSRDRLFIFLKPIAEKTAMLPKASFLRTLQ